MNYGLTPQEYELLSKLAVEPLKTAGAAVWIFGSRARGDHRPTSDIDLMYNLPSEKTMPKGLLYTIKTDLEESRISYTVDIVDEQSLAKSYKVDALRERKAL